MRPCRLNELLEAFQLILLRRERQVHFRGSFCFQINHLRLYRPVRWKSPAFTQKQRIEQQLCAMTPSFDSFSLVLGVEAVKSPAGFVVADYSLVFRYINAVEVAVNKCVVKMYVSETLLG